MARITDRQKDSEIIARLIYMAFVAPERANINIGDVSFVPFAAALELYARAAARETVSESDAPPDAPCVGDSCTVTYPSRTPEGIRYENVVGVELPQPPDTHTHTQPGPLTAEADSPSPSPAKDRAKSARSSNTCNASSTPTAARAAGSPRKPTAR